MILVLILGKFCVFSKWRVRVGDMLPGLTGAREWWKLRVRVKSSMAIYQNRDRSIDYHLGFGPFDDDLVLLQDSKESKDLWRPVLASLGVDGEGRILTCDWFASGKGDEAMADDFLKFIQALGLRTARVVACGDAAAMLEKALKLAPQALGKTLLWGEGAPTGSEDLARAIRAFAGS